MSDTTAPEGPAPPPGPSTDKLVDSYIKLRDKRDAIKKRHAEELAPYGSAMEKIEAILLERLNDAGLEAMKSSEGTVFKTTRTSAKVNSWSKTLEYIKEKDAWELLEARVSKTAVEAIVSETKAGIPGVDIVRETVVQVRRGR